MMALWILGIALLVGVACLLLFLICWFLVSCGISVDWFIRQHDHHHLLHHP